ncbi:hypothetical protein TWF730_007138 [Orbilia blumenaviensis]|uniref:Uncharacterized protein n=1 Tax=Orbilia blumenaviensis TaxID=1796055 RepID=A0AAV9VIR4_9PEZI
MRSMLFSPLIQVLVVIYYLTGAASTEQRNGLDSGEINPPTWLNRPYPRLSRDLQEDFWVFTIRKDHGKDKELDEIRKFIQKEIDLDVDQKREKWVQDLDGDVIWFYLNCSKGKADEIAKRWEKSVYGFTSVKSERTKPEPKRIPIVTDDLEVDASLENDNAGTNITYKGRLSKRTYLMRIDKQSAETCMVSQHPMAPNFPARPNFPPCVYQTNSAQGRGVTVYIMAGEFLTRHEDFRDVKWPKDEKEHIFADLRQNFKLSGYDNDLDYVPGDYRGTATLSKLLGRQNGIAKLVTPILVKISDRNGDVSLRSYTECLVEIMRRIKAKTNQQGKSKDPADSGQFIILSAYRTIHDGGTSANNPARLVLDEMFEMMRSYDNVAFVGATGEGLRGPNGKTKIYPWRQFLYEPITEEMVPQSYGNNSANRNVIIVGGCDLKGAIVFQAAPFIRVYAPVLDIKVALKWMYGRFTGENEFKRYEGAEYGAATVAGVLATFISAYGDTAMKAKERLYKLAYSRFNLAHQDEKDRMFYPPVVYNGFGQPPPDDNTKCLLDKRQLISDGDDIDVAATLSAGESCPQSNVTDILQPQPTGEANIYNFNSTFCKLCKEAAGLLPVDGVIWLPQDCPCQ